MKGKEFEMKKVGFIGAYDKTDFILYVAKLLVEMKQKVLVVDATITQKAKYVVPVIKPSKSYITEYEGIDIAVGFENFGEIKQYLAIPPTMELAYDVALIDLDTQKAINDFSLETFDLNYLVTSFDSYSIRRGIESLADLKTPIKVRKVLFSKEALKEEDDYINFLSLGSKIEFEDEILYLPFEAGDQTIIYYNQNVAKIKYKYLSTQYKEGLLYVASEILGKESENELRKMFKKIEKGV